jgi:hypothetical protein
MQKISTEIKDAGNRQGYGYGLIIEESRRHGRVIGHSGGYPGFGTHMRWHADSGSGIVALENATYSEPVKAARPALEIILDETILPYALPRLWPETVAARESVESLLRQWDPEIVGKLFADNAELDEPLGRRRESIERLAAAAGVVPGTPLPLLECSPHSLSPAHLSWTVPGSSGSLRCEIRLTPQDPPLVQTLNVRAG